MRVKANQGKEVQGFEGDRAGIIQERNIEVS